MSKLSAGRIGDVAAISLSGLCLAHCLALPLIASLLPLAGVGAEAPWVHWALALTAAPISLWTLTRRPAAGPLLSGLLGIALLFSGAAEFPSHETETMITVAGALVLSVAHILNWRRRPHKCSA